MPRRFRPAVDAAVAGPRAGKVIERRVPPGVRQRTIGVRVAVGSRADHMLCGQLRRTVVAGSRPRNPNRLA